MPLYAIYGYFALGIWAVFLGYWIVSASGAKRTIGVAGGWSWWRLRIALFFIIAVILDFLPGSRAAQTAVQRLLEAQPLIGALGVLIIALGVAYAIWARAYLAENWGMPRSLKENPELVTTGPYALARHPIYGGVMLGVLGSALVAGLVWFIVFLFVSMMFIHSAAVEERVMTEEFPQEYAAYRRRTKMFIPFVV